MSKISDKSAAFGDRIQDIKYCRALQQFLFTFKTKNCIIQNEHSQQHCLFYHNDKDKRRNPYAIHKFLYYPHNSCNCDNQNCINYHSTLERVYHPLFYKTQKCGNYYDCNLHFICPYAHEEDEMHFNQGQFFRFDITLFKTKPCNRKQQHQRKVCLYYHNDKDRRRPNFNEYSHIPCLKQNCNFNCDRAHNKIEQLYHPSRYKSKFCQTYPKDINSCDYRDFCSFAHTKEEITIEIIDADNKDTTYMINKFKTVWCPFTLEQKMFNLRHDRGFCPYAHNIQDYRRRPKDYKYCAQKCQAWDFSSKIESIDEAGCKSGMNCNKCHGWMQLRFHPNIYNKKGSKSYVRKQQPLQKKLAYSRGASKKSRQYNKIETIAYKQMESIKQSVKYTVGAPFFKNQREVSEASKKTKAKTGHMGSDRSNDGSDHNKCSNRVNFIASSHHASNKISSVYFQDQDHNLWNFEKEQNPLNVQIRSKSQGNSDEYEPSYSHSIRDFLNDSVILHKLCEKKVHEVSLINMNEAKLKDMNFLEKTQKEKLVSKLREYCLRKGFRPIEYSKELTLFFINNQADYLLQKLKEKNVKEGKLLKLLSKQTIRDFQFLNEEEKDWLPKLIKKYTDQKEFGSIRDSVEKFVVEPTQET